MIILISVVVEKKENIKDDIIIIDDISDVNHIKNVFRKVVGDEIRAVDKFKNEYLCKIFKIENQEAKDRKIILKVLEKKEYKEKKVVVDAGISLLKSDKMDLTIQKLTEIGINKIIPILAKRSVSKLEKKKDKWDKIVKESMKQCKGIFFTEIDGIKNIKEIDYSQYDLIVVPYECEKENNLKKVKEDLRFRVEKILYIIGPEGGFEEEEVEFLKKEEANIISLGNRILRAETAAILTGGLLIHEFQ